MTNPSANPRFTDAYEAWRYLRRHPIYVALPRDPMWGLPRFPHGGTLDIEFMRVNPETGAVDDNPDLNTKTEVWLETGPWSRQDDLGDDWKHFANANPPGCASHDHRLDCGGATFEEAIIELANNVNAHYQDDGTEIVTPAAEALQTDEAAQARESLRGLMDRTAKEIEADPSLQLSEEEAMELANEAKRWARQQEQA